VVCMAVLACLIASRKQTSTMLYVLLGLALAVFLFGLMLTCSDMPSNTQPARSSYCAVCRGPLDEEDRYCGWCGRFIVRGSAHMHSS